MPELPDVAIYVERLAALTVGQPIEAIRIASPFVLRTVSPSPRELVGATLLLASDAAGGFITGAEIVVDGGYHAMTI